MRCFSMGPHPRRLRPERRPISELFSEAFWYGKESTCAPWGASQRTAAMPGSRRLAGGAAGPNRVPARSAGPAAEEEKGSSKLFGKARRHKQQQADPAQPH